MSTPAAATPKGLLDRAIGVILSPRATYADIVLQPKPIPALALVVVVIASASYLFLSTPIGQRAALDQQLTAMESFGFQPDADAVSQMERGMPRAAAFSVVGVAVAVPVVMSVLSGILLIVFNAIMGGDEPFKQVFAIVVHSAFIVALQQVFVTPLNYLRESMSSSTSLGVFLPMLDSTSFLGMLAGSIDLFRVWLLISIAIGLGVLYKRRAAPIASSLLAVYILFLLVVAGVRAVRSGA